MDLELAIVLAGIEITGVAYAFYVRRPADPPPLLAKKLVLAVFIVYLSVH